MSIPNLPDSLYKVLVIISMILCGYFALKQDNLRSNHQENEIRYSAENKAFQQEKYLYNNELYKISIISAKYSKKLGLKSPFFKKDTIYVFQDLNNGIPSAKPLNDSIQKLLYNHDNRGAEIDKRQNEFNLKKNIHDEQDSYYEANDKRLSTIIWISIALFLTGFSIWIRKDLDKDDIELRKAIHLPTFSNKCQSCGKRFDSVVKHGLENDNNPNYNFCSDCYINGNFTDPNLTLLQLLTNVKTDLRHKGLKEGKINRILNNIKKLDRWKLNRY